MASNNGHLLLPSQSSHSWGIHSMLVTCSGGWNFFQVKSPKALHLHTGHPPSAKLHLGSCRDAAKKSKSPCTETKEILMPPQIGWPAFKKPVVPALYLARLCVGKVLNMRPLHNHFFLCQAFQNPQGIRQWNSIKVLLPSPISIWENSSQQTVETPSEDLEEIVQGGSGIIAMN